MYNKDTVYRAYGGNRTHYLRLTRTVPFHYGFIGMLILLLRLLICISPYYNYLFLPILYFSVHGHGNGMEQSNEIHLSFSNPTIKEVGELINDHKDNTVYNKKGIYTLECDKRSLGKTKGYGSNVGNNNSIPKWVWPAHTADERYYVGSSKRVGYRILQHIYGDGAMFTEIFPPAHIVEIKWVEASTNNLRQMEKEKAEDLKDDDTFVYQA